MGVIIHDLGELVELSEEEIAERIIRSLKCAGVYRPTYLYRGLAATPEIINRIRKYGTDRHFSTAEEKMQRTLREQRELTGVLKHSEKEGVNGELYNEVHNDYREYCKIATDSNKIWAGEEKDLAGIIGNHAIASCMPGYRAKDRPLIIVYRESFLKETNWPELHEFKKNVKPINAIVSGFTF